MPGTPSFATASQILIEDTFFPKAVTLLHEAEQPFLIEFCATLPPPKKKKKSEKGKVMP